MGAGCSKVKKLHRSFNQNNVPTEMMPRNQDTGCTAAEEKSITADVSNAEEEDELDSLSPISGITKSGSSRRRGLSAASTVLPGTSISLSPVTEEMSELDSCKPLPDLEEFPEDIRNLLLGRCTMQEPMKTLPVMEVSLLILANGPDTNVMIQQLHQTIVPKLEDLCHSQDARLNVFEFSHQTLPRGSEYRNAAVSVIRHLQSTKRCITLVVCGERPLPLTSPDIILATDFDHAVSKMQSGDTRELFHCSYRVDENSVPPCYRLQLRRADDTDWDAKNRNIVKVLDAVLEDEVKEKYLKTDFEDLLHLLVNVTDAASYNRVMLLNLGWASESTDCAQSEIARTRQLISVMSGSLPEKNVFDFPKRDPNLIHENPDTYLDEFSRLEARLEKAVSFLFGQSFSLKPSYPGINDQLHVELLHQQSEIHFHLKTFMDRPDLLSTLTNYVLGPQEHPLIVHGKQGRGKSALLAVASVVCGALLPTCAVLIRYSGVSAESMTQEQILRTVCEQLCVVYGEHPSLASRSIAEHNTFFTTLLKRACAERPMIIMLDGLDQLEEYSGRSLKWFPSKLPEHVKLILALRDGSNEFQELQERLEGDQSMFLEVPDLGVDESLSIVKHAMRTRSRRLTEFQTNFVRTCLASDNVYPRYALMISHLACHWNTLNVPEHMWTKHTVMDVFTEYVSHFISVVDLKIISTYLAAMCILKHGISDAEVLDILHLQHRDDTEEHFTTNNRFALLYLQHQLAPYVRTFMKRGHYFRRFRSRYFRKMFKSFMDGETMSKTAKDLLDYFQSNFTQTNEGGEALKRNYKHQRWREYEELTHLRMMHNVPVRKYFFDHRWLFMRVCSSDPYLVLEDIKMYRRRNPDDREFDILRKVLQLSAYALRHDGTQLYTQLCGRTKKFFAEVENGIKYPTMKELFRTSILPPVPSFVAKGSCLRTLADLSCPVPSQSSKSINSTEQLSWLGKNHLASFSNESGEIVLWNAVELKRSKTIEEVSCIEHLVPLYGTGALVMHHERIDVYDLEEGVIRVQMVELVDSTQKAVVLGGGEKVMAISEGRDEILCFDSKTGHVESRMHAGDNRHLDCLSVSEDGRTCVCGDILSKPYPLLVWEVQSGQLKHELAIPHHEYSARLTRLNEDGSLLLTVIKELLDCSPSALTLYDTDTGSVLWQGRAESNFTATAIHSRFDYAVGATENGPLHVFSLETGAKKYVLHGHGGLVNDIQVTANGSAFMTYNSTERCIRMWDAQKGSCMASFTCDYDLSCCTLASNGDHVAFSLEDKELAIISLIKGNFGL